MKIVLAILMFVGVLLADRDGGPYIGVGYGVSKYDSNSVFKIDKENESGAFTFYAGAYINKHLSVEFNYLDFNIEDSYSVVDYRDTNQKVSFTTYNVSTLAHYAFFNDILDFYAKFGVGNMSSKGINANDFTMLYGGGVGLRFSEMFSMKVAYDRYMVDYNQGIIDKRMNLDFIYTAFEVQF